MPYKLRVFTITLVCIATSYFGFGQKSTGFYLKLHQFNYPSAPLPSTCEVYGVSAQVGNKSIITRDHRDDKLVLHDLKVLWGGYDPGKSGYVPRLFSFDKFHKSTIPFENGFLLKIEMDDVELYHEYTGKDDIYEIRGDYEYRLSITHKNEIISNDTYKYEEVLGSFTSSLSDEDVHIIATNKASEMAIYLNEKILKSSVAAFRRFASNRVDLSFTLEFIKFYGISKTKKLVSGEKVKELEKMLRDLEGLDKDIFNRERFDERVALLVSEFKNLLSSEDYNNHDSYKFYVNANLASLYTLKESFIKANEYYEVALNHNNKARFVSIVGDELRKTNYRMKNKSLMFNTDGTFNNQLSQKYLNYVKTRKRANN